MGREVEYNPFITTFLAMTAMPERILNMDQEHATFLEKLDHITQDGR
jgi:hypothetical protein